METIIFPPDGRATTGALKRQEIALSNRISVCCTQELENGNRENAKKATAHSKRPVAKKTEREGSAKVAQTARNNPAPGACRHRILPARM